MRLAIDVRYQQHNIIAVKESGFAELTEFGSIYALILADSIIGIKNNQIAPLECYTTVEVEDFPREAFCFRETDVLLTPVGIKWALEYFSKYPFNDYIYRTAKDYMKDIEVTKE